MEQSGPSSTWDFKRHLFRSASMGPIEALRTTSVTIWQRDGTRGDLNERPSCAPALAVVEDLSAEKIDAALRSVRSNRRDG